MIAVWTCVGLSMVLACKSVICERNRSVTNGVVDVRRLEFVAPRAGGSSVILESGPNAVLAVLARRQGGANEVVRIGKDTCVITTGFERKGQGFGISRNPKTGSVALSIRHREDDRANILIVGQHNSALVITAGNGKGFHWSPGARRGNDLELRYGELHSIAMKCSEEDAVIEGKARLTDSAVTASYEVGLRANHGIGLNAQIEDATLPALVGSKVGIVYRRDQGVLTVFGESMLGARFDLMRARAANQLLMRYAGGASIHAVASEDSAFIGWDNEPGGDTEKQAVIADKGRLLWNASTIGGQLVAAALDAVGHVAVELRGTGGRPRSRALLPDTKGK